MKYCFVVVGKSESGDDYLAVFENKPSRKELKSLAFEWDGEEENPSGCGFAGSNVNINVSRIEIRKNEK